MGAAGVTGSAGFRLRGDADLKRIDPDRLGDVLELGRAEIGDREIEPPLDLPIGVLGKTDRAGLSDAFQPRGDIDAVAHQIAVALLDDVAEMNADAEFDAPVLAARRRCARPWPFCTSIAQRTASTTLRNSMIDAVAGALDDAAVMRGDGGIDQVAAEAAKAREGSVLVGAGKPAVADDVGHQDRREFPGFAHRAPLGVTTLAQIPPPVCLF